MNTTHHDARLTPAEQAIAEALRRERMALDDYAPMPDAPVPMEKQE